MNTKRKQPLRVLFLTFAVIVLYFALFPYPLGRELVAKPAWAVPLPAQVPSAGSTDGDPRTGASFQLGDVFGYVDGKGNILSAGRAPFRVSLSVQGFVAYSRMGKTWILQDTRGARKFAFSGEGYPLLSRSGDRLFTVKTDLSGITELDQGGGTLWTRDFPGLLTCLSVEGDWIAAGLLTGELDVVDRQGKLVFPTVPGEARIPIILGCALTPDGSLLASVSGIDPQTLTVWQQGGSGYGVVSRSVIPSDFRREVRMGFDPSGTYLYFEGEAGVRFWDLASRRPSGVSLRGGLAAAAFLRGSGAAVFLGGGDAQREMLVVSPVASTRIRETFTGRDVFAGSIEGGMLLGVDGLLLRVDLEAM